MQTLCILDVTAWSYTRCEFLDKVLIGLLFFLIIGVISRVDKWLYWEKLQMVAFKENLKVLQTR